MIAISQWLEQDPALVRAKGIGLENQHMASMSFNYKPLDPDIFEAKGGIKSVVQFIFSSTSVDGIHTQVLKGNDIAHLLLGELGFEIQDVSDAEYLHYYMERTKFVDSTHSTH